MTKSAVREETKRPVVKQADLYSWARHQAELLRAGRLSEIDPVAIAEEIDDVGEEQYDKLESALRVLMLHLLKWDHQRDKRSRTWTASVREQRRRVLRQLRKNPGLRPRLDEALVEAYEDARDEASAEQEVMGREDHRELLAALAALPPRRVRARGLPGRRGLLFGGASRTNLPTAQRPPYDGGGRERVFVGAPPEFEARYRCGFRRPTPRARACSIKTRSSSSCR